jgi:hypothetical protein
MPVMTVVVRADAERDPLSLVSAVREHVRSIDPLQPVTAVQTFDDIVAQSMATRRFTLVLLASFAGTALLLAIGGLYGALSYIVSQRARDIGVRVALGASARTITGLVTRQGMTPAFVGLGVGLLASVAIGRVIESRRRRSRCWMASRATSCSSIRGGSAGSRCRTARSAGFARGSLRRCAHAPLRLSDLRRDDGARDRRV